MEFTLEITIVQPSNTSVTRTLKLKATFGSLSSGYGNDCVLHITDGDKFEVCLDLRYDTNFNKNYPEITLATWVYTNWSGQNGSYDVQSLIIRRV